MLGLLQVSCEYAERHCMRMVLLVPLGKVHSMGRAGFCSPCCSCLFARALLQLFFMHCPCCTLSFLEARPYLSLRRTC